MAANLSLTQISSGNPVYDKYYRQVDPSNSGRVAAADAALFLKRSGLADLVLGKIWDLADSERKGSLNKQQFFIALRLVACAQNGQEVALKSLHLAVPPPKFHDMSSPLLPGGVPSDLPWVVKAEEKMKFDAIFDSLGPLGGMLTGDKVKPVLLNSKLPVDVLGRVWELSDLDRDGMLDRDEFAVAMYLVYRALEGETVPMSLPPPLVPPSKRKKPLVPPVVPLLPSPPSAKDRSSSQAKALPPPPAKLVPAPAPAPTPTPAAPTPAAVPWVVSAADKAKYDELFSKTDADMDGLVSGSEVRDIFLKTGLPSATLAHIWELCDVGDQGRLTQDQFALALHLIQQKLTRGTEPPQSLSADMVPPSDRLGNAQNTAAGLAAADFSAIKELDSLSNEIVDLQRERSTVEQDIKEKEEMIKRRTTEVQDLQQEVARETEQLQLRQEERRRAEEVLEELQQERSRLEEQLDHLRSQSSRQVSLVRSLQEEQALQEQEICGYEEELVAAREQLLGLQEETSRLQEQVQAAREQLCPLQETVRHSHAQVAQVQQRLQDLQVEERSVTAQLSWKRALEDSSPILVNGSTMEPTAELHQEALHIQEAQSVEQLEEEEPQKGEELKMKHDALEDLYTSLGTFGSSCPSMEQSRPTADRPQKTDDSPKVSSPSPASRVEEEEEEEQSVPSSRQAPAPPPAPPPAPLGPPLPGFFPTDPFTDHDPFTDDPFGEVDSCDPFGGDPFKDSDPFAANAFFQPPSGTPFRPEDPFTAPEDPFGACASAVELGVYVHPAPAPAPARPDPFGAEVTAPGESDPFGCHDNKGVDPFSLELGSDELAKEAANDPFAPGGNTIAVGSDPDPFAAVFGQEAFGGFADFSALAKSNGVDPFEPNSNNLFQEDKPSDAPEVPPALPPKTGTPTRPPPPPPGKRSSDSAHRRGHFLPQSPADSSSSSCSSSSSLPPKEPPADPFATSSPPRREVRDADRFSSFDKYPTEEDMLEWVKQESQREEQQRLARLSQQEQEDLELAIALSKSELS